MTKDGVCRNLRYDVMLAVQSSMLSPPGEGGEEREWPVRE